MSNDLSDEDGDIPDLGDSQLSGLDGESGGSRRRRLPIGKIILIGLGLYALIALFSSFSYAIQGGDPQDLGGAGEASLDGIHNSYVTVAGTANDVQAAHPQGVGYTYMALTESAGKVWVAIPNGEEAPADGFAGRAIEFKKADEWIQVEEYLKEAVDTVTMDLPKDDFVAALGGDTSKFTLGPDDTVVVATAEQDVDVQFGKKGFKVADAEVIMQGLAYPFQKLKGGKMHTFVARIPAEKREEVKKELRTHLGEGVSPAHPRLGATYVVRTETYKAPGAEVKVENGSVTLPFEEGGKVGRGYNLENNQLVERHLEGGRLFIGLDDVNLVRIERPLHIPDGAYVVYVGTTPGSRLPMAIAWIAILLGILAILLVPVIKQATKPKAKAVEDVVE
jgi:hypothetical protein